MSEIDQLEAILTNGEDYNPFFDLACVTDEVDGFITIAVIEGDNHRWFQEISVITKAPSGKFYRWEYQAGLTEMQESEYIAGNIEEVCAVTKVITVTEYVKI